MGFVLQRHITERIGARGQRDRGYLSFVFSPKCASMGRSAGIGYAYRRALGVLGTRSFS
jgi:hypothetical protein